MLRRTLALIALLSLNACAAQSSDPGALPSLPRYTAGEQARAADELEALPEGSELARMIGDYAVIREQIRGAQ